MQTFNKKHFKEILKPCRLKQYFLVKDDGVWPGIKYDPDLPNETTELRWRPARVLNDPTIDLKKTPLLPFDFTAKQLAAFMLGGIGSFVADFYGDWGDGPDPESLRQLDPDSKAQTAIVQAYAAYRKAESIVGAYPLAQHSEADRLRKEHREAKAAAKVKYGVGVEGYLNVVTNAVTPEAEAHNAEAEAHNAEAEAHNARLDANIKKVAEAVADIAARLDAAIVQEQTATEAWLRAMVQQLLQPNHTDVVGDGGDAPAPLTTGDIANCFAGLRWAESEWKKPLGNKPKWLTECVVIPGQRGVSETRWNPVFIGAALVRDGHVTARNVRAKFQTAALLKPWRDAWKNYEADNLDTE